MELGEAFVQREDESHFGRPQDVAFLPDGSALVADGLDNSRIVKFDRQGNFVLSWGTRGDRDGQFNGVHTVATDRNGRVYVSDRNNDRVQVFDENGTHLDTWGGASVHDDRERFIGRNRMTSTGTARSAALAVDEDLIPRC